ncbi:prostasin-like isoform X2 [Syngnathoides biaculeatus]|uniref:prostasin-like isoform X2 n=1 Tax=Syngnathoides biaculeatus TaxID=300417 RepID=UPI002ADE257D|nr:prostasin-like isoform X2 [Syngnathoides biaculeatus]
MPRTTWALLLGVILTFQESGTAGKVRSGSPPPGAWAWQVSIHRGGVHVCGGNVISQEWVLTTASCIPSIDPRPWVLYFGRQNQSTTSPNEVNRTVAKIIIHPDYDNETLENNFALMGLSSPLVFNNYIQPVCMASRSSTFNNGTVCRAMAWRRLSADEPPEAIERLQEVEICASDENRILCQDYSGGAVHCQEGPIWILTGVFSFSSTCDSGLFPDAFARVSVDQDWITNRAAGADFCFRTVTSTGPDQDDNFVCPLAETSSAPVSSLSILLSLLCIQALQVTL